MTGVPVFGRSSRAPAGKGSQPVLAAPAGDEKILWTSGFVHDKMLIYWPRSNCNLRRKTTVEALTVLPRAERRRPLDESSPSKHGGLHSGNLAAGRVNSGESPSWDSGRSKFRALRCRHDFTAAALGS